MGLVFLAEKIVKQGIIPSWDSFVYLPGNMVPMYAYVRSNGVDSAIIEVEVEDDSLFPDCDFLWFFYGKAFDLQF